MTLQSSGAITLGNIRTELAESGTFNLGKTSARTLAGVASGSLKLSDFYGKASTPIPGATVTATGGTVQFAGAGLGSNMAIGNGMIAHLTTSAFPLLGSTDGTTWNVYYHPFTTATFSPHKIYFLNGRFWILKYTTGGAWTTAAGLSHSADLVNWTNIATLPTCTPMWSALGYDPVLNVYVLTAGSGSSTQSARSTDGITFSAAGALPANTTWHRQEYTTLGGNLLIAKGPGTPVAKSSNGGTTWTAINSPVSLNYFLLFDGSKLIGLSTTVASGAYTSNGTSWTTFSIPLIATWTNMAFGGGYYVAVASNSGSYLVSTDGITWEVRTGLAATGMYTVGYFNGKFIAGRHNTTNYYTIIP